MEYTIKRETTQGEFKVINITNKKEYKVDVDIPYCSCENWRYLKGKKRKCKHIILCDGIK